MAPSNYCTRFAPSPTGPMHLGHARTALVTWLRARQMGGRVLMRIEDLDTPRVVDGAAAQILDDHRWLGLDWDGDVIYQSTRLERYTEALQRLRDQGQVYPCTCSRKEIALIASAPHDDLGPRYPGTCRDRPAHTDREPAWRFRMPTPEPAFHDRVYGAQPRADAGDFVVRRADGLWSYQLAVVVDDQHAGVTEVVRGADLLRSSPWQIALHCALGGAAPAFLHVPLVVDATGARLASRRGSTAIADYRAAGWSAEALIGLLAHSLGFQDDAAPASPADLLESEITALSQTAWTAPAAHTH